MQKINNICHIDAGVILVCIYRSLLDICSLLSAINSTYLFHLCHRIALVDLNFFFLKFVKAFTYSCFKTLSEFSLNFGNIEYLNQAGFSCVLCQ